MRTNITLFEDAALVAIVQWDNKEIIIYFENDIAGGFV